jgi:TRAP-type uncharacterized transport system substrate-binding protein
VTPADPAGKEHSVMPFRLPLRLAAALMASTVAGCLAVSVALSPTPVTLATGVPGGIYHPVGNAICRMFNLADEHQKVPCVAVSSEGSIANIRRVESGGSSFGLSQADVAYGADSDEAARAFRDDAAHGFRHDVAQGVMPRWR